MPRKSSAFATAAVLVLTLSAATISARAEDRTGQWGVGIGRDLAVPLGSQAIRDAGDIGVGLGLWVRRGFSPYWQGVLNYEDAGLGTVRLEPLTFSAVYSFFPDRRWTPTFELGLGAASVNHAPNAGGDETAMVEKAAVGLDYGLNEDLTLNVRAAFYLAGKNFNSIPNEADAFVLGAGLTYWFPSRNAAAPVSQAAPPPPQPAPAPKPIVPPPPPPVVAVSTSALQPSTTQAAVVAVSTSALQPAATQAALVEVSTAALQPAATQAAVVEPPKPPKKVSLSLLIEFEPYKADIRPEYADKIAAVAEFLKAHPGTTAEIAGYSDTSGKTADNVALSQRRADSVRTYLIEHFGVDPSRLTAKGYGPANPIADNATPEGRAANRRIVATFEALEP